MLEPQDREPGNCQKRDKTPGNRPECQIERGGLAVYDAGGKAETQEVISKN